MATVYLITPYDPIHWKDEQSPGLTSDLVIHFGDFSKKAKLKWESYQRFPLFEWAIPFDGKSDVSGSFLGEGIQILSLSQPYEATQFGQFIVWYRSYVPLDYPLFFFAEGSWDALELTETTTSDQIIQFAGLG